MIIYLARNIINGKSYIGQTKGTLARRKFEHEKSSLLGVMYPFHCALRKYGINNFEWTVIREDIDDSELTDALEFALIRRMCTRVPNGYNLREGGNGKHHNQSKSKMSSVRKGRTWEEIYGDERGAEIRKNHSKAMKESEIFQTVVKSTERNEKIASSLRGKAKSEETKKKMSEAAKLRWARIKAEREKVGELPC